MNNSISEEEQQFVEMIKYINELEEEILRKQSELQECKSFLATRNISDRLN